LGLEGGVNKAFISLQREEGIEEKRGKELFQEVKERLGKEVRMRMEKSWERFTC
jgi:hypothetical protein